MSYMGRASAPDWDEVLTGLQDTMKDILLSLELSAREGVRNDLRCLEALDELNRYLDSVKQDLGV